MKAILKFKATMKFFYEQKKKKNKVEDKRISHLIMEVFVIYTQMKTV